MTNPDMQASAASRPRKKAPAMAHADIHQLAPTLGWYTDAIVFAEEWENSQLSKRDRSIVTVSALVTRAFALQLKGHAGRALDNGVRPLELIELVTHLAFYAGWPCAITAFGVVKQVFDDRKIDAQQVAQSSSSGLPQYAQEPLAPGTAAAGRVSTEPLSAYEKAVLTDDLWKRKDLSPRDRSLATITCLIVNDECDALLDHVKQGLANGLTKIEIGRVAVHLAFYLGFPKMKRIGKLLDESLG
jgi:4-carboxymuconolactone decarboxylase